MTSEFVNIYGFDQSPVARPNFPAPADVPPLDNPQGYARLFAQSPLLDYIDALSKEAVSQGYPLTVGLPLGNATDLATSFRTPEGYSLYDVLFPLYPEFASSGVNASLFAVQKYLMRMSACYIEFQSNRTVSGVSIPSVSKRVVTSNLGVAQRFVYEQGEVSDAVTRKLSAVDTVNTPTLSTMVVPDVEHVSLSFDSKSHEPKVSNPRKHLSLTLPQLRVLPLFMAENVVNEIFVLAQSSLVKVTYLKDSGELRELTTTYHRPTLEGIYGSDYDLDSELSRAYSGSFWSTPTIARGYVYFPSVGESRFDDLTRAVNYSRIVALEFDAPFPDLSYVNVNTKDAFSLFMGALSRNQYDTPWLTQLSSALKAQGISDYELPPTYSVITDYVQVEYKKKGTAFARSVSNFMQAYPQLFPSYSPNSTVESQAPETIQGFTALGDSLG